SYVYYISTCNLLTFSLLTVFFFNDTPTPEVYTLSLHDALPISANCGGCGAEAANRVLIVDATHMPATIDLEYILDERGRELYGEDRKSTRLNSSHVSISYAVFCLKKKKKKKQN